MKKLIFILSFIFSFIGCEKYEFVDKNTRFNKWTGETEILNSEGEWVIRSNQLKDESIKNENIKEWESFDVSFPKSELRNVKISKMEIVNSDIYSNSYSTLICIN